MKMVSCFVMNMSNEYAYGLIISLLFFLPIAQSLVVFGIEYYYVMIKGMVIKIRQWISKCRKRRETKKTHSKAKIKIEI